MSGNFFSNTLNGPTYGPSTYGSNLLATNFFIYSTTFHLLFQNSPLIGTFPQNPYTVDAPFQDWPYPTPINTASFHQVV
jgi:hypothetical protein